MSDIRIRQVRTSFRLQDINEGLAESYAMLDEAIAGNSTSSSRLADAFRQLAEDAEDFGNISEIVCIRRKTHRGLLC